MKFDLLESVPDAMAIGDSKGDIIFVNRLAESLFGYEHDELLGQSLEVLVPADLREVHDMHREGYHAAPRVRPKGLGLNLMALPHGHPITETRQHRALGQELTQLVK